MIKKIYTNIIYKMGAGLIPVSIHNGNILFLFGEEASEKKWSDFGGGSKHNESKLDTAIREGYEETNGFFGTKSELKKIVANNLIGHIDTSDGKHRSYLFSIIYDPLLPTYFNNNHKFIKQNFSTKIDKDGFFEKSRIKWFTELELSNTSKFRPFYRSIPPLLQRNIRNIKYKL
jgi:hypothetical protein